MELATQNLIHLEQVGGTPQSRLSQVQQLAPCWKRQTVLLEPCMKPGTETDSACYCCQPCTLQLDNCSTWSRAGMGELLDRLPWRHKDQRLSWYILHLQSRTWFVIRMDFLGIVRLAALQQWIPPQGWPPAARGRQRAILDFA